MIDDIIDKLKNLKDNKTLLTMEDFYSLAVLPKDKREIFKLQEFLVDEVCKIHMNENSDINTSTFENNVTFKDNYTKFQHGKRGHNIYVFNEEGYEFFIVGDIHSDSISLRQILTITNFFAWDGNKDKKTLVFLGDYIDRGKAHLKNLHHILLLKYLYPKQVYLLRGNHDAATITEGRAKLCVGKPKEDPDNDYFFLYINSQMEKLHEHTPHIAEVYRKLFYSMCTLAFIHSNNTNFLLTHGGIPRADRGEEDYYHFIHSLSDLTNESIVDKLNGSVVHNMLWSDPRNEGDDLTEDKRRFGFIEKDFLKFSSKVGIDYIIRGHEAEEEGYKYFYQGKVTTIFSSGALKKNGINVNDETAYNFVSPKIIKLVNGNMKLKEL